MENEIIKRFRKEYEEAYRGILGDEQLKEGNSWFEQFILSELQKTVNDIIKLSDDIENSHSHTEFDEWRAFKQFRNTLRDKYLK